MKRLDKVHDALYKSLRVTTIIMPIFVKIGYQHIGIKNLGFYYCNDTEL